jgi:hypothetical protein
MQTARLPASEIEHAIANKFLFHTRTCRDKFPECDSITIYSGSYSRKVSREQIAQAPERYLSSVRRHDLICARTGQDSHCSQQKSFISDQSFMSSSGSCAEKEMFGTYKKTK